MSIVIVEWTQKTGTVQAPSDLNFYRVRLEDESGSDAGPPQFVGLDITSTRFDNVGPGEYIARVALSNQDGTHVEGEMNDGVSVPAPGEEKPLPDVVTAFVDAPAPDQGVRARVGR